MGRTDSQLMILSECQLAQEKLLQTFKMTLENLPHVPGSVFEPQDLVIASDHSLKSKEMDL